MSTIASIINSLGINKTIFVQMGIFIIVYWILKAVVFKPYQRAYDRRKGATTGSSEDAQNMIDQAQELEDRYQKKAREINAAIKAVYEKTHLEAVAEEERVLAQAREATQHIVERSRIEIQNETQRAREALARETPEIGAAIADRLLGARESAL